MSEITTTPSIPLATVPYRGWKRVRVFDTRDTTGLYIGEVHWVDRADQSGEWVGFFDGVEVSPAPRKTESEALMDVWAAYHHRGVVP